MHGAEDLTVPVNEARALARAAPSARLLLIEGAGHTFEVSHPMEGRGPPHLGQAIDATLGHLQRHLLPGD